MIWTYMVVQMEFGAWVGLGLYVLVLKWVCMVGEILITVSPAFGGG